VESPTKKSVSASQKPAPDVLVANGGTVFTFCPLTDRAKTWIDDNVQSESYQWLCNVLVVEHRYAWGLALGMQQDGLILK
jgi:hypothetical protein